MNVIGPPRSAIKTGTKKQLGLKRKEKFAQLSPEEQETKRAKQRAASARCRAKYRDKYNEAARIAVAATRKADPAKHYAKRAQYEEENFEKIAARQKLYRTEIAPEKERERAGMVFAAGQTIASMRQEQKGLCAICERRLQTGRHTCVDHCHKTGKVRGLLCHKCNKGIGFLDDNPDILISALEYLLERN